MVIDTKQHNNNIINSPPGPQSARSAYHGELIVPRTLTVRTGLKKVYLDPGFGIHFRESIRTPV